MGSTEVVSHGSPDGSAGEWRAHLVIDVLKEHEKSLDKLMERLDTLIEAFSQIQARLEVLCESIEKEL